VLVPFFCKGMDDSFKNFSAYKFDVFLPASAYCIRFLRITPDERLLIAASDSGKLKCWNIEAWKDIETIKKNKKSPKIVALGTKNKYFFSKSTGVFEDHSESSAFCATYNGSHTLIAQFSQKIVIFDRVNEGSPVIISWEGECRRDGNQKYAMSLCTTPDSTRVIVGFNDQTIGIFDIKTGNRIAVFTTMKHDLRVMCTSFDGKYIFAASYDSKVMILDIATGKCLKTLFTGNDFIVSICLFPNGKYIAAGTDKGKIKLLEAPAECWKVKPFWVTNKWVQPGFNNFIFEWDQSNEKKDLMQDDRPSTDIHFTFNEF
jgi:WD40 repeat protein